MPTAANDNERDLNEVYKSALARQSSSQKHSRLYRQSVARDRYWFQDDIDGAIPSKDVPLDLYRRDRNEFISVFNVDTYLISYLGFSFSDDGPRVFKFENRGEDIFSAGQPVYVATIPKENGDWFIGMFRTRSAALRTIGKRSEEVRRAA